MLQDTTFVFRISFCLWNIFKVILAEGYNILRKPTMHIEEQRLFIRGQIYIHKQQDEISSSINSSFPSHRPPRSSRKGGDAR